MSSFEKSLEFNTFFHFPFAIALVSAYKPRLVIPNAALLWITNSMRYLGVSFCQPQKKKFPGSESVGSTGFNKIKQVSLLRNC